MQSINQTLGRRLRALRLNLGLTIEELAFRAGLHPNYLGDIERGRRNPTIVNIAKVAAALNVEVSEVFTEEKKGGEAGSDDRSRKLIGSLLAVLQNISPSDRKFVLSTSKSIARRLAKNI